MREANDGASPDRWHVAHFADPNGDGRDDLVLGKQEDPYGDRASMVYFSRKGAFSDRRAMALPDHPETRRAQEVIDIATADLTGDGTDELILLAQGRRKAAGCTEELVLQVFARDGRGGLTEITRATLGDASFVEGTKTVYFLDARDLNGDGLTDLQLYGRGGRSFSGEMPLFLLNTGGGVMRTFTLTDVIASPDDYFNLLNAGALPVVDAGRLNFALFGADAEGRIAGNKLLLTGELPDFGPGVPAPETHVATRARETFRADAGEDVFVFAAQGTSPGGRRHDRIAAFRTGEDLVDLSGVDAVRGGEDDAFRWIGASAFAGEAGELRMIDARFGAKLLADLDGDGQAEMRIDLLGVEGLDAGDFIL